MGRIKKYFLAFSVLIIVFMSKMRVNAWADVTVPDSTRVNGYYREEKYNINFKPVSDGITPNSTKYVTKDIVIDMLGVGKIYFDYLGYGYKRCCDYLQGGVVNYSAYTTVDGQPQDKTSRLYNAGESMTGIHTVSLCAEFSAGNPCPHCGGLADSKIEVNTITVQRRVPFILGEPVSTSCDSGGMARFSVNAYEAATYEWQKKVDGNFVTLTDGVSATGTVVTGAASSMLTLSAVSFEDNNAEYRCFMKSSDLIKNTSQVVTLSVNYIPPVITPTQPAIAPDPTVTPTDSPVPSAAPTINPSVVPTVNPTVVPTVTPTDAPTGTPTVLPSMVPTVNPTVIPTQSPLVSPTAIPIFEPTPVPSVNPTTAPNVLPTRVPTTNPPQDTDPSGAKESSRVIPTKEPTKSPAGEGDYSIKPTGTPKAFDASPSVIPSATPSSKNATSSSSRSDAGGQKGGGADNSASAQDISNQSKIPVVKGDEVQKDDSDGNRDDKDGNGQKSVNGSSSGQGTGKGQGTKKGSGSSANPKNAAYGQSSSSRTDSRRRTITSDGIVYVIDDGNTDSNRDYDNAEYDETYEESEILLDDYYEEPGALEGYDNTIDKSKNTLSKPLLYTLVILGSLLGFLLLIFILFFGVIVEGECEDKDEVFDFCFVRIVYRKDGRWCVRLSEAFEENAVIRLRFGLLFTLIFKDWEIVGITCGSYEGEVAENIAPKLLMYRRKIRRNL